MIFSMIDDIYLVKLFVIKACFYLENRENHETESESQFFQIGTKALAKVNSTNSPSLPSTQSSQSSGPLQPLNVTVS